MGGFHSTFAEDLSVQLIESIDGRGTYEDVLERLDFRFNWFNRGFCFKATPDIQIEGGFSSDILVHFLDGVFSAHSENYSIGRLLRATDDDFLILNYLQRLVPVAVALGIDNGYHMILRRTAERDYQLRWTAQNYFEHEKITDTLDHLLLRHPAYRGTYDLRKKFATIRNISLDPTLSMAYLKDVFGLLCTRNHAKLVVIE